MHGILRLVRGLRRDEHAATAVEYALIAALVAGVVAVSVGALGIKVDGLFTAFVSSW